MYRKNKVKRLIRSIEKYKTEQAAARYFGTNRLDKLYRKTSMIC